MTFTSEAAYYLTLLEQMMICTFFYHHISRPKKSYWFTVGFYFACVAAVHIAFLPFGEASLQAVLPHIILILAQFPVMIWYEDTLLRKVLLVIGNCTVQTVLESLLIMLYAAMSHTDLITFTTVDSGSTQLAAGRIFIIDLFLLAALLIICLLRRNIRLMRDMAMIIAFVCGHFAFVCGYLYYVKEALTEIGVVLQRVFQTMFLILLVIQYYNLQNRRALLRRAEELKTLRMQMENNEKYYRLAESKFTEISKLRHDMQAQIQTVSLLMRDPEGQEHADRMIETIRQRLDDTRTPDYCENRTLNALLSVKLDDERYKIIPAEIVLRDCGGLPFDDYDLCSLMSNLYDNAAESCLQEKHPEQTVISLKSGIRSGCFVIRCVNTCSNPPEGEEDAKPEDSHSCGRAIIRSICGKYDGEYTLRYESGKAIATVAISLDADPAADIGKS
ncbi:MAG: GHKL domain-containing protein [Oscillospiraceae bacterium]|nr:GHKL domain-containing protein [Oscillospiraceae bacterium]MBR3417092.1 GHKL domain-containing protein [Oscillospiraceae bacterium]